MIDGLSNTAIATYFQGKTVLVTGAAGFVGRHLVHHLSALGAQVVALDRIAGESLPRVHWVVTDVLELTAKDFGSIKLDILFHLAAVVGVTYAAQHPAETVSVNAVGTSHVIKLARTLGVKSICLMSSSEVYGEPVSIPITEKSILNPLSVYGWSKVCAEQILEAHAQNGDLCAVVIRPFNVYGPDQRNDFVVSRFLKLAMQGLPLKIAGTGMQRRNFTFIDDLILGMLLAITKNKFGYNVYNIAGVGDISILELADLVISMIGSSAHPIHVPLSDLERDTATEVLVRIASFEKARREIGYQPQTSLENGLKITYTSMSLASNQIEPLVHLSR